MNLFFLLVFSLYNYLIFKISISILESKLRLYILVVLHFSIITIALFLYTKFFLDGPLIQMPKIIICLYMSISPIFFLLANIFRQNVTNEFKKSVNNGIFGFKNKKDIIVFYFIIVSIIQLGILFS
jgi:hypothetical protein